MKALSKSANFKDQTSCEYDLSLVNDNDLYSWDQNVVLSEPSNSISLSWKEELLDQALDIYNETSFKGWDGYDANPITKQSLSKAIQFISLLPNSIDLPELAPENSGDIGFEWAKDKTHVFSLAIKQNRIIYAGLFGRGTKKYGEEPFSSIFPSEIKRLLIENFSKE